MSTLASEAIDNAARLLRSAEAAYMRSYGYVPRDNVQELAGKWIDLANAISRKDAI